MNEKSSPEHERDFRAAFRLRDDLADNPYWQSAYEHAATHKLWPNEMNAIGAAIVRREVSPDLAPPADTKETGTDRLRRLLSTPLTPEQEKDLNETVDRIMNKVEGPTPTSAQPSASSPDEASEEVTEEDKAEAGHALATASDEGLIPNFGSIPCCKIGSVIYRIAIGIARHRAAAVRQAVAEVFSSRFAESGQQMVKNFQAFVRLQADRDSLHTELSRLREELAQARKMGSKT